jgi:hypothetical protein
MGLPRTPYGHKTMSKPKTPFHYSVKVSFFSYPITYDAPQAPKHLLGEMINVNCYGITVRVENDKPPPKNHTLQISWDCLMSLEIIST